MEANQVQEQTNDNSPADEEKPDELALLKQRAKMMGVSHSPNIGLEALRKKISDHLNNVTDETETDSEVSDAAVGDGYKSPAQLENERKADVRRKMKMDHMKLIRVRITNLNPQKKDLHGEIFTVRNKYLGIVKHYVPYGEVTDEGWHLPEIIVKQLKARKFLHISTKTKNGQIEVKTRWAPEFAIEELPQLTKEELADLKAVQGAQRGRE